MQNPTWPGPDPLAFPTALAPAAGGGPAAQPLSAYDALASLFLGEPAKHTPESPAEPTRDAPPAFSPRLVGETVSPAPIPTGGSRVGAAARTPQPPRLTFKAERARIECLVMGHLPVLASAWAGQYVRAAAAQLATDRPERPSIAYVQLRAGHLSIDVVGEVPESVRAVLAGAAEADDLDRTLRLAAHAVGRWIIRVDDPEELGLAASADVDAVTLLTGSDEAAVVGAYRVLKSLAESIGEPGEMNAFRNDLPETVRVAVMGGDARASAAAYTKLSHAARTFLNRDLPSAVAPQGRIESARPGVGIWNRSCPLSATELVARIRSHGLHAAANAVRSLVEPFPEPTVGASATYAEPAMPRPVTSHTGPDIHPSLTPKGVPDMAPPLPLQASVPGPLQHPAAAARPAAVAAVATPTLAAHVPGLIPLDIRCPYAPGVELAIDTTGRLHALLDHTGTLSPADADGGEVETLLIACSWLAAHAGLVARLMPQGITPAPRPVAGVPPQLHLFVDQPREVRRLLETDLRVYVLIRVPAANDNTAAPVWVCRALN